MNRVLRTARVQLESWPTRAIPLMVLAISFAFNLALYAILGAPDGDSAIGIPPAYGSAIAVYGIVMTQYFAMSLGFGVTRRTFYLAASLLALIESLAFGVLLYVLKLVEDATGGWGMSLSFFGFGALTGHGAQQILIYAVPLLTVAFLGMFMGVTAKRWAATGMFTAGILSLVVFGGLAVLVTWLGAWSAIGTWFATQSTLSLFAGWPLLLAAVLAAATFGILRRATP